MGGDVPVGHAAGDQDEHLVLALGELVERSRIAEDPGARVSLAEARDEPRRHRRSDHAVAGRHHADAGDQVGGRRALEQKPTGARLEAFVHVLVQVERGEDEHARALVSFERHDLARGLDAVHLRHLHVHEHHVRVQPSRELERLGAVAGLAHHFDVVLGLEDQAQSRAYHLLVVRQHHGDAHVPSVFALRRDGVALIYVHLPGSKATGHARRSRPPPADPLPAPP